MEDFENGSCAIPAVVVEPTDRLHVPHRKRMTHAYVIGESSTRELYIYYGNKEVVFDEDRLFGFGEQLVRQTSFIAETATSWGPGYEWSEIRGLLETLVAEGVLRTGDATEDPRGGGLVPSPLPPSTCPVARAWSTDTCESITRDLAGGAVEIGYLEAILSVYRIAHPALDADGRQVGEANVFPRGLRLDRETEWRVCQYAGSRYRDEAPMNVTALKAMVKHWKPMMQVLLEVHGALRQRLPRSRDGWTVGDLHLFSGVVLSLPAFPLMLGGGSSPQAPIDPVLSSLFRITDGVRMTTHLMLFLSDERTRSPEEPTTATDLYEFAERNNLFISTHGVCSGPRTLIDEFLGVVFDGTQVRGADGLALSSEVQQLLSRLPDAIDYALLGLQSWAVSRSVWLAMSRAYRVLRTVLDGSPGDSPLGRRLRERVAADWTKLNTGRIATEYDHDVHVAVYTDTYEQAWRALGSPVGAPALAELIAPRPEDSTHLAAAQQLRAIVGARFPDTGPESAVALEPLVSALVHYLREEQSILAATEAIQAAINAMLDRPRPTRALTARRLRAPFVMHGDAIAEFPYLFDTLEDELGIRVACTAGAITVTDQWAGRAELDRQDFAGASAGVL
jgi:hypothetical protein